MRSTQSTTSTERSFPAVAASAAAADALLIMAFAAIGRDAHARGDVITGVLLTAWPFLTGAAVAWLLLRLWRGPLALWPAGVAVWLGALCGGMALRALTGQTVVLPFVIVALISLAVLLLGYRLLIVGFLRLRRSRRRG
ncbi:peptidoglycan/LPS O-acetylase OafA/YrhL [Arthrobacter pascens]|uniref:DUF3054 domain-containing protein n=1 Tax=Arthrobacter pascens TaxID=1677 RepID=UPI00285601D3|nr:DUF3054 domain-containing protein [Arthrobacter pascens]MDR6556638.1 peptidoglycan/LPS O-acetylase OafA/YrhL [Arthrobacter pascens]